MPVKQPNEIRFSGALNNLNTAIDLFQRKRGEVPLMVNCDITLPGKLSPLKTLLALNAGAGTTIHSLFVGNGVVFIVDGITLQYLSTSSLVTLLALTASTKMSWAKAGNWIFCANGADKQAIYINTPVACAWGLAIPTVMPTVADSGTAGNPNGTYSCYYRYRVTLPDGSIILTALSPVGSVTLTTKKINWTVPAYPTFTGATSVHVDLFRTSTAMAGNYLVTTLTGATTYTDDLTDAALQLLTVYAETGYYPPPAGINLAKYCPASDRVFAVVGNVAYWSEPGKYHVFLYKASVAEYESVNSVFLAGENITAVKIIDEQMYFGSTGTWRRLRGKTPVDFKWEDTPAIKGPINDESAVETPWGVLHPSIDGTMWMFTGITSRQIVPEFVFATRPTAATAHATFDGRFYRLFYGDAANPELMIDFLKYPELPPRVVQSTRSATASFYDKFTGKFYMVDAQYVRNGVDASSSIAMRFQTPDIPLSGLSELGKAASLVYKCNTQGEDMTVTPYVDDVAGAPITINTATLKRDYTGVPFGDGYAMSLLFEITSAAAILIEEPFLLKQDG